MDKQEKIRGALKNGALDGDELKGAVGFSLQGAMTGMLRTGEVRRTPAGKYELTPGWTPAAPGEQRTRKKKATKKTRKSKKTAKRGPRSGSISMLALSEEAFTSNARHLAVCVRECVEDLQSNPLLVHAVASFELADRMRTESHA